MKVLVEPSGIVGMAAVKHRRADFAGKRVGVIWSGGNLDPKRLAAFLAKAAL
jgi:threonine dehydratase